MCGIAGYAGKRKASEILLKSIKNLEYRGYDSVGMATLSNGSIQLRKGKGKVAEVDSALDFSSMDGTLGSVHCLHPDTYVQLSDGRVCRISEVEEEEEVETLDLGTLRMGKRKCLAMRHPSPKELYEIHTATTSIVCTGEHRMFVACGANIKEKKTKELEAGDLLLSPKRITISGVSLPLKGVSAKRYYKYGKGVVRQARDFLKEKGISNSAFAKEINISHAGFAHFLKGDRNLEEEYRDKICNACDISLDYFAPVDSIHGKNIRFPSHTTPELLQFLGYLQGDGHVQQRCIRFKDSSMEVIIEYANLAKKLFNIRSRIAKLREANAFLLEINSKFLCDWLKLNFPEICKAGKTKTIPGIIGTVPGKELLGYLRGLFDAEATCNTQSHQITILMVNQETIRRLQFFLLRFGIPSSLSIQTTKWGPSYRLSINTADGISLFMFQIGFASSKKSGRARKMLSEMKPGFSHNYKPIPFTKSELHPLFAKKHRSLKSGKFFTGFGLSQFAEELDSSGIPELPDELTRFIDGDVFFQEVKKVKKIPSDTEWVYDLHVPETESFIANCLISHNSRWATHGTPSERNAHPHISPSGNIAIVHNGIIENYLELKEGLKGNDFRSETDSEVIAHLLEKNYSGSLKDAMLESVKRLNGTYAICAFHPSSEELVVARNGSPLAIGIGEGENFIGSDVSAFVEHTKKVVYLEDSEVAVVRADSVEIFSRDGTPLSREARSIGWDIEQAQKQGYRHFMLKEIHEQPQVARDSLSIPISLGMESKPSKIFIVACGTAGYAGLTGKYILEKYSRIPVEVAHASEFRYSNPVINPGDLFISISQSGETADTLAALRLAKQKGAHTLGIINVAESTIARESDSVIYTRAGPEIGVASTKAFISQLIVLYKLAEKLSGAPLPHLQTIPEKMQEILSNENAVRELAKKHFRAHNFLYIGRGFNFPIALEGALKLKEISYAHAEGYASGEMKHGPIALVCEDVPTVAIAPRDSVYSKAVSNMQEIRARNGKIIAIATKGDSEIANHATDVFYIPETEESLYPLLSVLPLQLFAYHVAELRGCDIDKPRNLAKSVTVE